MGEDLLSLWPFFPGGGGGATMRERLLYNTDSSKLR